MFYPQFRARRIRGKEVFRKMVRETTLSVNDLIYPMFSAFGTGIRNEISSMPGIYQLSIENIVAEAKPGQYDDQGEVAPLEADPEKARAAAVFQRVWRKIEADAQYKAARAAWPSS